MAWPTRAEFNAMMQNPRVAFRDKQLHTVEIERGAAGMPRARAGAFADVYRAIFPNQQSKAIRVFASNQPERLERYRAIYEHLSSQSLGFLVPFDYSDNGMRATDGKWYPLITMDWVKGDTLFDWLQKTAGSNDGRSIGAISEKWRETVQGLHRAKIAHGDLQHANVMVTDSAEIKLVDYDGMCVPKIIGRKNEEIGVEPYQHPERNGSTQLSLSLDNFSSAFIYVGLKALSAEPRLWQEFVVAPSYDKILFRKEDFDEPSRSALFSRLRRSPDGDVQRLATRLSELWRVRIDQVPFIDEMLFSWESIRSLPPDFDGVIAILKRNNKQPTDAPPDLQPLIKDAQQRVAKLTELTAAVDSANEAAMASLAGSPLLQGYPKASSAVAVAADAATVVQAIARLDAAKAARRWRDLVQEWDASLAVLQRPAGSLRKSVAGYQAEVNSWRQRNGLCDQLLACLRTSEPDVAALAGCWKQLADLGGHPECDPHRNAVDALVSRERAWRSFQKVPRTIDEPADRALVAAWNESVFAGWPKAEAERGRLVEAGQRLQSAAAAVAAAGAAVTKQGEEQVIRLAAALPAGYAAAITQRVDAARKRLEATAALDSAVQADSDAKIAKAFRALESLQAGSLADPAVRSRIDTAVKREAALGTLAKIPTSYTPAQATQWDAKMLAAWDEQLFKDCRDAAPWKPVFDTASRRRELLGSLEKAIAKGDAFLSHDIAADPSLAGYPFAAHVTRELKKAETDVVAVRGMIESLKTDDKAAFTKAFSARVVRDHATTLRPFRDRYLEWLKSDVLPCDKLGLQLPRGQRPLECEPGPDRKSTRCRLSWQWPAARFTDECAVLLCRNRPAAGESPEKITAWHKFQMTRENFEKAGGSKTVHAEAAWKGCYVVVWARIDLGDEVMWSEPLVLGKV
jgi:serine/threonine protein kinase